MTESQTTAAQASVPTEKTFRAYTEEQAIHYAKSRRGYHEGLYKIIADHHTSTGGEMGTLLDVGCGPGTVAREFAPQFARAVGLDAAPGMIAAARSLGGVSSTSEPIRFDVSTAEELGSNLSPAIAAEEIDLISSAAAAHWYDMPAFWAAAARVLKPGGTVAIWTGNGYIHPSTPNHQRMQAVLEQFQDEHLASHMAAGNLIGRTNYETLPLPWTLDKPIPAFDEATFVRKEFNKNGADSENHELFLGKQTWDLDAVEKYMSTISPVTRWREANPDLVGTEKDVVRRLRREVEMLLHEGGVERGEEKITTGVAGVLLLVKKKA
ncbi:methyltransferase domain-containing protein [Colletotrichum plurivorum]|uniref:Methyltransferase domain-containing protein n=1 Tax=Colletotrichum plurivorum TaxID=2175906 RepID=A0A8H6KKN9_9PEZI|nr:methyltransferase domain-containing protein [Colletotrichum plurivorum]